MNYANNFLVLVKLFCCDIIMNTIHENLLLKVSILCEAC